MISGNCRFCGRRLVAGSSVKTSSRAAEPNGRDNRPTDRVCHCRLCTSLSEKEAGGAMPHYGAAARHLQLRRSCLVRSKPRQFWVHGLTAVLSGKRQIDNRLSSGLAQRLVSARLADPARQPVPTAKPGAVRQGHGLPALAGARRAAGGRQQALGNPGEPEPNCLAPRRSEDGAWFLGTLVGDRYVRAMIWLPRVGQSLPSAAVG